MDLLCFVTISRWRHLRRGVMRCPDGSNAKTIDIDPSHIDLIVPVTIVVGVAGAILLARIIPADPTGVGEAMSHGPRVRVINLLATGVIGVLVYSRIAGLSRISDTFFL